MSHAGRLLSVPICGNIATMNEKVDLIQYYWASRNILENWDEFKLGYNANAKDKLLEHIPDPNRRQAFQMGKQAKADLNAGAFANIVGIMVVTVLSIIGLYVVVALGGS